jgi:alkane 1-monooxygenase
MLHIDSHGKFLHLTFLSYLSSNILLHADHHMNCLKEYEKLNAIEGSPIMPHTYVTMILLSIIPSLFFKVVHPHLEKFKNKS